MRLSFTLASILLAQVHHAYAKAVFAHFMVSNAENYTLSDWESEIKLAQDAHIDAFAMNMAYDQNEGPQLENAFSAARSGGFKLFFSFDYAGNGAWPKDDVIKLLRQYGQDSAHYYHAGQPFVSTFEGPQNAEDWTDIKRQTGCFFVPDWSSKGAKAAMELANGVADGLFNWAAWPWGNKDMDTYVDASYYQFLNGKPYMMPVSPWFYTHLPGYNKNWLWRGDHLWFDRWQEALYLQPEWIEIISWNDFGESHYIGPIVSKALGALDTGRAPFDYVSDMPHDAWRKLLPFTIEMYKQNTTIIERESVVFWYRPQPAAACRSGQTTTNTASQLEMEFTPVEAVQDSIFFTALLKDPADVSVSIGGVAQAAEWSSMPADKGEGNAGLYHGSAPFDGRLGEVVVTVSRDSNPVASGSGIPISTTCNAGGLANWNAWVGSADAPEGQGMVSLYPIDKYVCIRGMGANDFAGLCEFTCRLGYCPIGACVCTQMGIQEDYPNVTNVQGYPGRGKDANYAGLCSFACNYGYCPEPSCATFESPLSIPTVSPFAPPACTGGTGSGAFAGLCDYACNFGFCPIGICTCTAQGPLNQPPPVLVIHTTGVPVGVANDFGLCDFACSRGYCPDAACNKVEGGSGAPVYIDPGVWDDTEPLVSCIPPCVIILPPYRFPETTVISFPPYTETLTESCVDGLSSTTEVVVTFPPITTTEIPVYNLNITSSGVDDVTYTVTPSLFPSTAITIDAPDCMTSTKKSVTVSVTSSAVDKTTWPHITDKPTKVTVKSSSPPGPTCTGTDCGTKCEVLCNDCGPLGCNPLCVGCLGWGPRGGGGGTGCIGPKCGSDSCVDVACSKPSHCEEPNTVSACIASCKVTRSPGALTYTTDCYTTRCTDSVGCDATPTTTTTRTTSGCPTLPAYTPWWTALDQLVPTPGDSDWGGYIYDYGTYVDPDQLPPMTSATPPPPPTAPDPKTPTAKCTLWYEFFGLEVKVYDIANWATDGGRGLRDNEQGCGAIAIWDWHAATDSELAKVEFTLPVTIKAGCVERAIASAGGPKIQCAQGTVGLMAGDPSPSYLVHEDTYPAPPNSTYMDNYRYIPMDWSNEAGYVSEP